MTLGKKLSNYRKLADMTQQQLGDYLNVSAQAISKWENDLAEPDLRVLKMLSTLYKVSVDEILNLEADVGNGIDTDTVASNVSEAIASKINVATNTPIGHCMKCGITVTQENLGTTENMVLCKSCVEKKKAEEAKRREDRIKEEEAKKTSEKRKKALAREEMSRFRNISFIVAGIACAIALAIYIVVSVNSENFSPASIPKFILVEYIIFSFVCQMFYEGIVTDVVWGLTKSSFNWPGLIFTFDIDGCLWLIGMKLLFAVLGFLIASVTFVFGLTVGIVISPFIFPFKMYKVHRTIKSGVYEDMSV